MLTLSTHSRIARLLALIAFMASTWMGIWTSANALEALDHEMVEHHADLHDKIHAQLQSDNDQHQKLHHSSGEESDEEHSESCHQLHHISLVMLGIDDLSSTAPTGSEKPLDHSNHYAETSTKSLYRPPIA